VRYFIDIAYDGAPYHGWQRQPNAISVQQVIEEMLANFLKVPTAIIGSGRTDTGVHARSQVFHVDIDTEIEEEWIRKLNRALPTSIAIKQVDLVDERAHARFDATERAYAYYITFRKDPFRQKQAWYMHKPLDLEAMQRAASLLIGEKDFQAFSLVNTEVNHFYCTVMEAAWHKEGQEYVFTIKANRFLRGMIRALVGTMVEIGKGNRPLSDFETVLLSKDRKQAGMAAPPNGLYLNSVLYPERVYLKRIATLWE
jgi:tRNA pseudouridine38-40 synthase